MSNQTNPEDESSTENATHNESADDLKLTPEEEEQLKKKIEELRKRDPFIYR
mgnify:CR=1 FL=1